MMTIILFVWTPQKTLWEEKSSSDQRVQDFVQDWLRTRCDSTLLINKIWIHKILKNCQLPKFLPYRGPGSYMRTRDL